MIHFARLQIFNIVTTLALCCHGVAKTSRYNVAATLSTGPDKTSFSNELATTNRLCDCWDGFVEMNQR